MCGRKWAQHLSTPQSWLEIKQTFLISSSEINILIKNVSFLTFTFLKSHFLKLSLLMLGLATITHIIILFVVSNNWILIESKQSSAYWYVDIG